MSKVIENYLLNETIGSGQYGKVFKATHLKTELIFAIKAIKIEKFRDVPKLSEFTTNEIQTLVKINNPNIIKFVEMLRTSNNVYMVYEFCNGGTLEELIKSKNFLSEQESLKIFQQILNAFNTLFKENILHRDLKPTNILLNDDVIKVADFGFCKTLMGSQDLTKTMVGSPIYMAPEILKGQTYNIKADIWSMGVVLFQMLFGYCPFEDKTIARLISQIDTKALQIPKNINNISKKVEELLHKMLVVDPKQRIEWEDLLNFKLSDSQFIQNPHNSFSQRPSIILPQQQQEQPQQPQININFQQVNQNYMMPQFQQQPPPQTQTISQRKLVLGENQNQMPSMPSNEFQKQKTIQPKEQTQSMKILLKERNKIFYQIRVLHQLLESSENSDMVSFLLLKNINIMIYKLKSHMNNKENQFIQKAPDSFRNSEEYTLILDIIDKELENVILCLNTFKEEISKMPYDENIRKEIDQFDIDKSYYRSTVLSYIDSLQLQLENIQNKQEDNQENIHKQLVHANEILDCLMIDDLFDSFQNDSLKLNENLSKHDSNYLRELLSHKVGYAKVKIYQ